jgi:hypothetical protein
MPPEFIPSPRLPDNFVPNVESNVIRTTDRNDLWKKMKFSLEDQGFREFETNQLLRSQVST